jgi:hypothetical protein
LAEKIRTANGGSGSVHIEGFSKSERRPSRKIAVQLPLPADEARTFWVPVRLCVPRTWSRALLFRERSTISRAAPTGELGFVSRLETTMSRRDKQFHPMDRLDHDLRVSAVAALREVAEGRSTSLFVTDTTNPWPELRGKASPAGNDIVERAREILRLATEIGADNSKLAATKILRVFTAANDLANANRLGPIRLAASLLEELGPSVD